MVKWRIRELGPTLVLGDSTVRCNTLATKVAQWSREGGSDGRAFHSHGNDWHHREIEPWMESTKLCRQPMIVSTMNPYVVDCLGLRDAGDTYLALIFCPTGREPYSPTWEEAQRIYAAYKAGVQHLSEILRVGGFW